MSKLAAPADRDVIRPMLAAKPIGIWADDTGEAIYFKTNPDGSLTSCCAIAKTRISGGTTSRLAFGAKRDFRSGSSGADVAREAAESL